MAWRLGRVFRLTSKLQALNDPPGTTHGWSRGGHGLLHRCGFKRTAKKPDSSSQSRTDSSQSRTDSSSQSRTDSSQSRTDSSSQSRTDPSSSSPVAPPPPRSCNNTGGFGGRTLAKPLLFTVAFTGCSFATAAIWQDESLTSRRRREEDRVSPWDRTRAMARKPGLGGDLRGEVSRWWSGLSECQRTASGLIAANVLVFCCWRVTALRPAMSRHFTSNPENKAKCLPMVLSAFSHRGALHLAANMYCLWSFSSAPAVPERWGPEQFLAVYVSAAAVSTLASHASKTLTGRTFVPSLGASGAIMALLAAVCTATPGAAVSLVFLPGVAFSAADALKGALAVDAAGLLLGWRLFDHAAHLGGALFGVWYVWYGHELIWKKTRERFVQIWRDLRRGSGGGAN